jgi:hypothetical protein
MVPDTFFWHRRPIARFYSPSNDDKWKEFRRMSALWIRQMVLVPFSC